MVTVEKRVNFEEFRELLLTHFKDDPDNEITWTDFREEYGIEQKAIANKWISILEDEGLVRKKKKGKTIWSWSNDQVNRPISKPEPKQERKSLKNWLTSTDTEG